MDHSLIFSRSVYIVFWSTDPLVGWGGGAVVPQKQTHA